jgi:hypothetical protein
MEHSPRQYLRHAKIEELLEAVFSVMSVQKLYHEDQRDKPVNLEKSRESEVGSSETEPSEVVADNRPWGRQRIYIVVNRCIATPGPIVK